ncbi:ABC transporter ATP-binding protein [Photobacterium damselae subsp. damselae]|uniref:ABC transporter ATP-binding protein n=1 Tax=Photobacterium damselae TaxID=38293 RepID=UPI000D067C0B|nr:ABC transporter ATP-binding protein [Photobacterium damselae]PSB83577.1 ABC transporter ATP-binding protein [Photobacterium damselae subsp. damselae]UKA08528.1 ABC transporter ATP-binding protein [Photobacterium damselae subsp. damselae]UKA23081.1 ABC transporter ATP-binding protein [Photobacterium damselae subsp. damselae]
MYFLITSFAGAGSLKFGMTPDEVRSLLGANFKSFKRMPNSEFPCDYFESLGVFVYYKLPGVVEAIEFADPAAPEYENNNLLKLSFDDLKKILLGKDKKLEVESDSLTSHSLGIGVYAPDADEDPSLPVESIIVFEKDYYD